MITGNRSAYWVLALALGFLAEGAGAQVAVKGGVVRRVVVVESSKDTGPSASGPATLVPYDDEVNRYLAETRSLIEAGQIDHALRNLQVLLGQQEALFVPAGDGRRYVALRDQVNEVIGQLDRQGLRRYRMLYEPPAERLYQQAVADGDRQLLRKVVRDYVHTQAGLKALEALGHEAFNRAQFLTAARHWRRAIGLTDDHTHAGVLLAQVAVAHHLAGQSAAADQAQGDLEAQHADLEAPLGGRTQNVLAFVRQMRQRPAWPKQAALSGAVVMSKAEMPSETEWIFTHQGQQLGPDLALLATEQSLGASSGKPATSIKLRDGLIVAQTNQPNGSLRQIMPALIYPVVVDGQLILRTEKAVISCDLRTGQPLWRQAFPVYRDGRELRMLRARMGMRGRMGPFSFTRDIGRYWLAVGDGKVFVTGRFRSVGADVMWAAPPGGRGVSPSPLRSELMAISIHQQGRVIWSVPDSRRSDSELGVYEFVSPPVYHEGKVLLVASYAQSFHLLCLDADDGRLLWKSLISQMPETGGIEHRFPISIVMELVAQASPPAVADGRVFVATNAGVVAAYEVDSGRALWAYQYDRALGPQAQAGGGAMPINPVLVLGDSVICLPADGSEALCLSGEDGRLRWRAGRKNQHYLTALDDRRVLLSREGLRVLSVDEGGKTLLAVDASGVSGDDPGRTGVYGRPVVMPTAALLSGRGELIRLDLTGDRLTPEDLSSFTLPGPGIILGNLITADGRIIAANAAGVAAYVSYETVCRQIDAKLASAPPARRLELLYRRAMAAVNSRRYAAALADLRRCERTADELAVAAPAELDGMLYRTYVAVGNRADSNDRMLAMFAEADRYAQSPQERGHNLLRRAKAHAAGGDIAAALAVAHDLADRFGEEDLVDVEIGPAAGMTRFGPLHVPISGWTLIHEGFIADLIAEHGQDIYAPYDVRAEAELAEARQLDSPDALETVGRRWPNSARADEALFAAAERFYRQADDLSGDQADARLERARGALAMIVRRPDSPLAVSAHVGRAALLVRRGHNSVAGMAAADARRLARREAGDRADQMPVRFADLAGPLGDVLVQILEGASARPTEPEQPPPPDLPLPLKKLFVIQPASARLLRESLGKVIRIDRDVFVFTDSQLLRIDTAADN
ncbi:MAG TPA: hypothetical protein ENH80_05735, partial [Phycisphaerae bacterium]|nr:hypothetical protein [Phycisphaerae bacterium]